MKLIGYCTKCGIGVTEQELGSSCTKCGTLLDELTQQAPEPVVKQNGKDVSYNRISKSTPGVWNKSSTKTREHNNG